METGRRLLRRSTEIGCEGCTHAEPPIDTPVSESCSLRNKMSEGGIAGTLTLFCETDIDGEYKTLYYRGNADSIAVGASVDQ